MKKLLLVAILVWGSVAGAQQKADKATGKPPNATPPRINSAPVDSVLKTLPDDMVVAIVDGQKIKMSEVDAYSRNQDPKKLFEMNQQLYQLREEMLNQMVGERLLIQAAAAAGLTKDAFLAKVIPTPTVTEQEIFAVFSQGRGKNPMTYEQSKPLIQKFLEDQKRKDARKDVIEKLKEDAKKAGKPVAFNLQPPRMRVPVKPTDPMRGTGVVEIVEFSDFQCPYCQKAEPVLKALLAKYDGKVRLVWKDAPLPIHQNAIPAALAARCAAEQGKFWEYHDVLFANQEALDSEALKKHAVTAKLDTAAFAACSEHNVTRFAEMAAEVQTLAKTPVEATPTFFINGRMLKGTQPLEAFTTVIDQELARTNSN